MNITGGLRFTQNKNTDVKPEINVIFHIYYMYPKNRAFWVSVMINFDRPDHCHDQLNWIERSGVKHKYINI